MRRCWPPKPVLISRALGLLSCVLRRSVGDEPHPSIRHMLRRVPSHSSSVGSAPDSVARVTGTTFSTCRTRVRYCWITRK
jgi:hypothetical protein